jgi:hypothetical protein
MLESVVEVVFIGFFICWALFSILGQFKSDFIIDKLKNRDPFSLIPQWHFFAPHAAEHDFYILYRDADEQNRLSDWQEVKTLTERSWWTFLWNPHKRRNKAVFDVSTELLNHLGAKDEYIEYSVSYLALLLLASDEPRLSKKGKTQFMLMKWKINLTDTESEMVYVSKMHDIE